MLAIATAINAEGIADELKTILKKDRMDDKDKQKLVDIEKQLRASGKAVA